MNVQLGLELKLDLEVRLGLGKLGMIKFKVTITFNIYRSN